VLLIITCNPTYGLTEKEQVTIKNKLENTCNLYNTSCNVHFGNTELVQAFTTAQGNIVISTGLANKLSYNEVLAVGYHEVGHRVLKHHIKFFEFIYTNYPTTLKQQQKIRHEHEIEADLFATVMAKKDNTKNYLPSALKKIVIKQKWNEVSSTHPSINQRIKIMKSY
jgi:Zn-dependent protease with chaperone function